MTARAADRRALRLRGVCAMVLLACAALASPAPSHAQNTGEAQTNERSVMAAYIYRFITYVEWPVSAFASPEAPIVIGVVNADDIASELEPIVQGRTAQGRRLQVRRLALGDALTGIHVLFVGGDGPQRASQAAKLLTGRPVLTITGIERGMDHGSMINFVHVDGRVRFEVNVVAAEKSGLRLSSRLLTVATRIKAS